MCGDAADWHDSEATRAPLARCPNITAGKSTMALNLCRAAGQENDWLMQSHPSRISTEMTLLSSRTQLFRGLLPRHTTVLGGQRLQNATSLWKKRKTQNFLQIQNLGCTLDFKPFFFQPISIFLTTAKETYSNSIRASPSQFFPQYCLFQRISVEVLKWEDSVESVITFISMAGNGIPWRVF